MKQYLEAGKIVATHGIRGEVRIEPWCDSADFIARLRRTEGEDAILPLEAGQPLKGEQAALFRDFWDTLFDVKPWYEPTTFFVDAFYVPIIVR